jgi:hypothetical protein
MEFVTIGPEEFKNLKKEYKKAVKEKRDIFNFMNKKLYVDYAKYLIEHLENEFKKKNLSNLN